jgi:hypothetical protein
MHPSANFIKYALASSWGETTQLTQLTMSKELQRYGLLQVDTPTFDAIRESFNPPEDFKFPQRTHPETKRFMTEEKLLPMWIPDEDMKRMISDLLHQHLVAEKVRILIMGDVPSAVIAELISRKFRLCPELTERMVAYYRHFCWNPAAWSFGEWSNNLKNVPNMDSLLASLDCGPQQALYRAGFNPKYDPKQAMRDSHRQVTFRIQAIHYWPDTKSTVDILTKLCREERAQYERLYGEGSGLIEQAKEIRLFMMEHHIPAVVPVEKWIKEHGGSYSNDGTEPKQLTAGEIAEAKQEAHSEPDPEPVI